MTFIDFATQPQPFEDGVERESGHYLFITKGDNGYTCHCRSGIRFMSNAEEVKDYFLKYATDEVIEPVLTLDQFAEKWADTINSQNGRAT